MKWWFTWLTVCLWLMGSAALQARPLSQSGLAGAGGLLLLGEPGVEMLESRVSVELVGDTAHVVSTYLLQSAAARSVRVSFPFAVRPVELDGVNPPSPPWWHVEMRAGGRTVPLGFSAEPDATEEYVCGEPLEGTRSQGVWLHLVHARVELPARQPTEVELHFSVRMTHDDWLGADGRVEFSPRVLCLKPRPLRGFVGQATGMFRLQVDARNALGTVSVPAAKEVERGSWRGEAVLADLKLLPDTVIRVSVQPGVGPRRRLHHP